MPFGYLQHSAGASGPFCTEKVCARPRGWPFVGLWECRYAGRWRAVRVLVRETFIVYRGERITIQIDGV